MSEIKPRIVYLLKRTDKPDDVTDIYVGSTSLPLEERLRLHRNASQRLGNEANKLYVKMREVGLGNWGMVPLLSFSCNKETILCFEKEWCKALNVDLNTLSPITNKKEYNANYYESNRETIKQYHANYYESNRETIKQCHANYRESNRETIKQYQANYHRMNIQNKRFYCEVCEMSFRSRRDLKRHLGTLKHSNTWMNSVD